MVERLCWALRALKGVEQGPSRFGSRRNRAWSVKGREFALEFEFHTPQDVADVVALAREAWAAARKVKP